MTENEKQYQEEIADTLSRGPSTWTFADRVQLRQWAESHGDADAIAKLDSLKKIDIAAMEMKRQGAYLLAEVRDGVAVLCDSDGGHPEPLKDSYEEIVVQISDRY